MSLDGNGTVESIAVVVDPQPMYNLTVDEAHTFFVGDGAWLVHNTKCLLPGEGDAGTYSELRNAGNVGDNLSPHHMPSNQFMRNANAVDPDIGYTGGNGIAMNMESPLRGSGRHQETQSFGGSSPEYLRLSPRDALASDIYNQRNIYQSHMLYEQKIVSGLLEVIRLNKQSFPALYSKANPWSP